MAAAGVMTAQPMLVAAGASIVAGDIAAEGSKKASEQQQAAADKAITTQEKAAAETKQAYSPYTQTGQAALGTLSGLMGLQVPTPPPGSTVGGMPITPPPLAAQVALGHQPDDDSEMTGHMGVPKDGATPKATVAQMQSQSGYGGATLGRAAGMVQMRAPTGDVEFVPSGQVPFYQSRGAQIIGFDGKPVGGVL